MVFWVAWTYKWVPMFQMNILTSFSRLNVATHLQVHMVSQPVIPQQATYCDTYHDIYHGSCDHSFFNSCFYLIKYLWAYSTCWQQQKLLIWEVSADKGLMVQDTQSH